MFRESLEKIAGRCPGLVGACLVGRDGLPIDTLEMDFGQDLEMLSAELVALAQAAHENHREFGGGPLRSLTVETDEHVLLMGEAGQDVFLLVVLSRSEADASAIARARFELRRAPLILEPELYGDTAWR